MAIEKMYMANLVGAFSDFDKLTKLLALSGFMQPISALQEINTSDFSLKTSEDNIEALIDVGYIRPYIYDNDIGVSYKKVNELLEKQKEYEVYNKPSKDIEFNINKVEETFGNIYTTYEILKKQLEELIDKKQYLKHTHEVVEFLKDSSIVIEDLYSMKNFKVGLYKVKNENMIKLKANYENIPSVIQSICKQKDFTIFISFTPLLLVIEAERIFKSANCEEIEIPNHYEGTPSEVLEIINNEMNSVNSSIRDIETGLKDFFKTNHKIIGVLKNSYELELKAGEIKKMSACTQEFFYTSGWIPKSNIKDLEKILEGFEEKILVIIKNTNELNNENIIPPTKLKNNRFIRPFQSIVGMYGVPNYHEIDPTLFLAITYTLMFGAMFGDVGQGIVLFIAGIYLRIKLKRVNLGGVLETLGISSTIFGFLYGSIFGSEHIINAVLIRPMEEINDMLVAAVIFGCVFLLIGFVLGIINKLKIKDIEHGIFGKEGLMGFIFYVGVLLLVADKLSNTNVLPTFTVIIFLILCLILILLKQPLANKITGKKVLFNDGAKDYFIEASFEVIETILSMFSNTVSFIRVGAFALNHVGLFVAFSAMAEMSNNGAASILILILGNIIIIGLEGLIVFIQGLRLQYYELFGKYYNGGGILFEPIEVSFK